MILAVVRKDLAVIWSSPIPWVAAALFHLVLGLLYVSELVARRQALIQPIFPFAGFLLLILVPILTMRSIAEESRTGTLDLLQTIPVPAARVVLGKWIAAWLTTLLALSGAGVAVLLVAAFGDPDPGPAITGFLGLALISSALAAIGVFASSMTTAQPVAAVFGFFVGLILWFAQVGSNVLVTGAVLAHLSISERLRSFAAGVIDTGDVAYLVILTAAALTLASTAIDARRLR